MELACISICHGIFLQSREIWTNGNNSNLFICIWCRHYDNCNAHVIIGERWCKKKMVDLISTPLLVTLILGVVGLAIPGLDAFKKERGSNNRLYSGIASGALIVTIGIVIFRGPSGEVMPAVLFSKGVITDDLFGSFFAIALLIVSIMVTVSSWNYMKGRINPAPYYSLILLSSIGTGRLLIEPIL